MGVKERHEKRIKAAKNNKSNIGVAERSEVRNFTSSLPSRLEDLSSRRKSLYENYTSRFTDKEGNYINAYRGDTEDALTSFNSSKAYIDNESKAILDGLTKYEKYFDADKVKGIQDYLSGYSGDLESMYKTYQTDYDYYSRYADEESYNRAMTYAKEQEEKKNKYSSMSDDELEAEIERLKGSKKGNALSNLAMKVVAAQNSDMNLYAEGESNQEYNDSVNNDISLIEKEQTNRKYKQIDELPEDVKSLVDELTAIESGNDENEFVNDANVLLSGFTGGSNVNYNANSNTERYKEIVQELENKGIENWRELLDYNKLRYNEEKNTPIKEGYADMAKEHPVLSSFVSIPASLGKGLGVVEMIENIGSEAPLDPNSSYFGMNDLVNTTRETVMDEHDLHLNTGNKTLDSIDLFDELYSTGMSIGDSVTAGVGLGGVNLGGVALGLSAASDSAQEIAENGGSSTEAIVTGLVAGLNEMLWESLSLGRLNDLISNGVSKRGFKAFVGELFKSMGINASEELNTEAANLFADYLINGGASTYSKAVQNYLAMGYADNEAKAQAGKDMLVQVSKAGVGGALQGLFMGVGGGAISSSLNAIEGKANENKYYNKMGQSIIDKGNLSQLEEEANALGGKDVLKALKNLANETAGVKTEELDAKGKKQYAHQVGKLYKSVQNAQIKNLSESSKTAFRNVIKAELEKMGIDDVETTADILVKAAKNEALTRAENKLLQSVNGHELLNKAFSGKEFHETLEAEKVKQGKKDFKNLTDTITLATDESNEKKLNRLTSKEGYEISTNGKTIIDATNEEAEITAIASFEDDGDVRVSLDTGAIVSVGELKIDEDTAVILNGLKELNAQGLFDDSTANYIMVTAKNGEFNVPDFMLGAIEAVTNGSIGYEEFYKASDYARKIPESIRNNLFERGKNLSVQKAEEKEKRIREVVEKNRADAKKKGIEIKNPKSTIRFEGVKYSNLNESQKAQVDFLEVVFSAMGINVVFFESPLVNGVRKGENGSFDPNTKTIRIDVAAGINGEVLADTKALMIYTAAHELTHFIREWSPVKFKIFADFLIQRYIQKDVPLKSLINAKIENANLKGRTLTFDGAYEEVVADACESFLLEGDAKEALVALAQSCAESSEGKGLFAKILKWLEDFTKVIKNVVDTLKGAKPNSEEANYVLDELTDDLGKLHELWETALWDARENALWAGERVPTKAQKNTTDEGDVKFEDRTFSYSELVAKGSIQGVVIDKSQQVKFNANGDLDIHYVFNFVKSQCEKIQTNAPEPTYYLNVPDIGKNVEITNDGIKHGFIKWKKTKNGNVPYRSVVNARAVLALPQILKTSIEVNRSDRNDADVNFTHIMMGTVGLEDTNGTVEYYAVRSMIQDRINQDPLLVECEVLGKLYATNAKKIDSPRVQTTKVALAHSKVYAYNIADFLEDVKNVFDNTFSEDVYQHFGIQRKNDDFAQNLKFQLRSNVEETKNLVAVHNLSEENLLKSLKLGGLPMPSIAIIKAKNGHNHFGDISLVFDKSTIDPKASRYNKVFTSDAYTPTYPNIDYKIDSEVVEKGVDEVERLITSRGYGKDDFGYLSSISGDNFRYSNTEEVANKVALKVAYLIDKGIDFTPVYEEKQYSGFGRFNNEVIKYIADAIGKERINELHNNSEGVKKAIDEIRNLANEQRIEKAKGSWYKPQRIYSETNFGFSQSHEIVEGAYNYFNNGTQTKIDEWQTSKEIANLIDNDDYKKWVDNLFDGFIEKEGIRNDADLFTPSGNRRSFEALHWEHNLENVVKSMRKGLQQGKAMFGSSIYGAAQAELKSIADIKNESDRLVNVDSEESDTTFNEKRKDLELRFTELVMSIVRDTSSNYFIVADDASAVLVESVLKCKTKTAMDNYIKRELEGWGNYSSTLAGDLMDIVNELRTLPTGYFEAKPQRAVMFDEVKAVIIPDNASQELREQLDSMGLNVLTYEHGNDNSRTEVLNSVEDVKFQDRDYSFTNGIAKLTDERIEGLFTEYGASNPQYAQAYITSIHPRDFLKLTLSDGKLELWNNAAEKGADKELYSLDLEKLKGNSQTPYLTVDTQTGEVIGHEGRHRMRALLESGITSVPIAIVDYRTKYSKQKEASMRISSQDYGDGAVNDNFSTEIYNLIPLNKVYENDVLSQYGGEGDIKYQDRPYQPSLEDLGIDYKAENEHLKADVERLKEMHKLQGTVTHGKVLAKATYEGVAKKLLHEFGMKRVTDTELLKDFINKLDSFYSYIINSDDLVWEDMFDKSMEIAKWMDNKLPEQVVYKNPNAVEILRDIREKGVMLSDKQKEEAAYYAGSLNAYRKMNIGSFRIVNEGGITLTDLWEQITTDYPGAINQEYIEKGEAAENLPSLIVEVVEVMRQTENVINDDNRMSHLREMATAIYDSYWNIPTVKTLADKHQQKVNLLKSQHKAEMDALREKKDSKLEDTKAYYQDMVKRIRADKDAKMDAYKERVQEQKKKNVEGRNKTATKNKIKRVIKTLESLYSNPTKEKNVKIEFQDMVNKALIMADTLFDDGNISSTDILSGKITIDLTADERKLIDEWKKIYSARQDYRDKLDALESSGSVNQNTHDELLKMISKCNNKLNDLGRKLSGVVERQRGNLNDHSVQNAIDSLVEAYKSLEDSTEGYAKAAYNDYVAKRLDALKTSLKNATVKTMTLTQLEELYQAYKMVLTTVRTANELFVNNKKVSVAEMGNLVIREVEKIAKPTDDKIALLRGIREFSWEELKPIFAFERIGSKTFLELFKDARRGEDVLGMDLLDAYRFFHKKSEAYGYDSWDFKERKDFRLSDGRTFNLSLQEIMSIYAYSKREQALDHITKGGFVFDDKEFFTDTKEKGLKGKIKKERTTVEAYRLGIPDFQKIINSLTKEQKKFIDDMQEYLSSVMGAKGNEVSRVLYGIDLFKEKYYFPLMSSNDFMQQTNNPAGEVALKNSGMAKATVPHARNPIVLQGFMDVWANHINKMSTYHALVLPIENLNKVFNYTGYARDNRSVSVQTVLKGVYGDAVNRYISNFITDLNGGIKSQSSGNWVTKGVSLFKKTAVAGSTSVVIQQPTAIVRAMAMISPKYFVHGKDGIKHSEAWEELKKYAPVAIIKEMGGFDVGSGRQVAEYITKKEYKGFDKVKGLKDSAYRDDVLMWGATKADEIGWITIWNAVKKEIADTTTYKNGSDEFLKACGERFTDIITYTQVYDSVFSRSGFMRNKGEISKMATSFMGEPTTSFNMLYNAVLQAKRGNISKGEMTKIMGATVSSIILASIAKSLIYALRDDDEDESYAEKYAQSLTNSLMEDLFIPNMLPYVSDITSLLSGWDVERTDMAVLKDLKDAVDGLDSSSKSLYRKIEDLAGAVAAFGGIPAKNVMRTVREMYNLMANVLDDNTASASDVGDAITESIFGETSSSDINEALEKGNTTKAKKIINDLVADKVEQGKTEKEAKASIKASVTSYWKELYLQAYRDKDNAEMLRIRKILQSTGLYDNVVETCSNWIKSMKDDTTSTTYSKW